MAATAKVLKKYSLGRTGQLIVGTIAFDSSYPTNGEAITLTDVEYVHHISVANSGGYSFEWDKNSAAPSIKAFYADNNNAADGPQIEVPNTTDLSALTDVRFTAITG